MLLFFFFKYESNAIIHAYLITTSDYYLRDSPGAAAVKNPPANARDTRP